VRIVTRVVVQPREDGEPVEIFDREEGELDPHRVQDYYVASFGEPHDFAFTEVDDLPEPVAIGWAFAVPTELEVPGSHEDFELLLIPMIPDPCGAETDAESLQSLFVCQARERRDFQAPWQGKPTSRSRSSRRARTSTTTGTTKIASHPLPHLYPGYCASPATAAPHSSCAAASFR
jgi:hypothetical protein